MLKIKINGKQINYPTSWDDLTYGQFIGIMELEGDRIKMLSLLSGLPYETFNNADVIVGLDDLLTASTFILKPATFKPSYPMIGPYKVPFNVKGQWDIRFESMAQFEDMRSVFSKLNESLVDHAKKYGRYVAIYVQKVRDGHYDSLKVPDLEAEVMNYNAGEVITLGSFFFLKLRSLLLGTPETSQSTAQRLKKSKQVLKSYRSSSARMPSSQKSPKK